MAQIGSLQELKKVEIKILLEILRLYLFAYLWEKLTYLYLAKGLENLYPIFQVPKG